MSFRRICWRLLGCLAFLGALYALQRPFREYPGVEYSDFPLPVDAREKTEWVFARLMYPSAHGSLCPPLSHGRFGLEGRPHQLDARLSARRPPLRPGLAALDAGSREVGRAAG